MATRISPSARRRASGSYPGYDTSMNENDIRPVELDPRYAAALDGVAGCSHLVLLYFMDRARRDLLVQAPRHGERRGTFAIRSPVRPNPSAMSVVRLVRVEGTTLTVIGLDCLDGTPLVDIKPYFATVD